MTFSPVQRRNVMRDEDKSKEQLIQELAHLRQRVEALETRQQESNPSLSYPC